jgi:BolA protein
MKERIIYKLTKNFQPSFLQVIDNSSAHNNHFTSKNNLGTHFKIIITSSFFNCITKIQAHRLINKSLEQEFLDGLHALEIKIIPF